MQKVKQALNYLEALLHAFLAKELPALHTAWQATVGVLAAGIFAVHSTSDVKALVVVVVATFLAALKKYYLSRG